MNVFHRFTRRSLAKNPSRTLVTVIGIVLSMALVTAVIQGAYSGIQFLIRSEVARVGAFHAYFYELTEDEAIRARQADNVKSSASWQTVGWAEIDSRFEWRPYLVIRAVSDNFTDLVAVHLLSGRMPENSSEILLPEPLMENGYRLGDTVTLDVGRRMVDGRECGETEFAEDETLTDTKARTYTVVGIYRKFDYTVESFSLPGYTGITRPDGQETGPQSVFFTVKNPARFYEDMATSAVSGKWETHSDLLRLNGAVRSENLSTLLYGFAGVLIFLISFGSISLIYNSFAISVSERTQQFGILKSVGATRRQVRRSVLYEALLLGGAGILGGAAVGLLGIGITLWTLRDAFSMFASNFGMEQAVQMKLVVSPGGLVIAAAVCLVTTLISAWIPAQRANRVSAIDAIRQTGDIKVRGRDVKVSRLTKKLFGFEGMMAAKNFKRNRKRYRATVVSLFLSVTLFIAASSFCTYLTDTAGTLVADASGADIYYSVTGEERPEPDKLLETLASLSGVEKAGYMDMADRQFELPAEAITQAWRNRLGAPDLSTGVYGWLAFLDETTFDRLCRDNGLSAADYHDADAPRALLFNRATGRIADEKGNTMWYDVQVVEENALPLTAAIKVYEEDRGDARRLELTVWATVKEPPFLMPGNRPILLYPYAMRQAVLGERVASELSTTFALRAPDHARVYEAVKTELKEQGLEYGSLLDQASEVESLRMLIKVVRVFSYGFIILISLIAMANVFNTVSTNVMLRRREFAMLRSIGLGEKGFRKMMNYECIIYGCKGLMWGLPAAVGLTYVIYRLTRSVTVRGFYIPWHSVAIAVGSVFAVVFATMLYSTRVIRRDNPIDALRQENL